MEVGARDVQGLPLLAKPAPRQSYSFMAGKPAPSNLKPPGHAKGTSELTAPSLERRGSWLEEAWALYSNLGGIHYFLKGISDALELSSFQKMHSINKLGVFSESKSASADQREEGAWGWMIP